MGKTYDEIDSGLAEWIGRQKLFFVATAPLATDGMVNCSPKGLDSFAILDGKTVAYLDLTGSGVETVAHVQENGRIVVMFCALEGPAKIVRLHGKPGGLSRRCGIRGLAGASAGTARHAFDRAHRRDARVRFVRLWRAALRVQGRARYADRRGGTQGAGGYARIPG